MQRVADEDKAIFADMAEHNPRRYAIEARGVGISEGLIERVKEQDFDVRELMRQRLPLFTAWISAYGSYSSSAPGRREGHEAVYFTGVGSGVTRRDSRGIKDWALSMSAFTRQAEPRV